MAFDSFRVKIKSRPLYKRGRKCTNFCIELPRLCAWAFERLYLVEWCIKESVGTCQVIQRQLSFIFGCEPKEFIPHIVWHKVHLPYSNMIIIWMHVFELYVIMCASKNGYYKRHMFKGYRSRCSQHVNHSRYTFDIPKILRRYVNA